MALKAVLASLDGLDEALQGLYKAGDDGRFFLDVEGVDDMPAVVGLKQKNTELLDEKKAATAKLAAFGEYTPEKIEELREAAKKAGGARVQELEAKLEQASKAAQTEILEAKQAAEAEREAARSYFKGGEVNRAISSQRGNPELLSHLVDQHIDVKRNEAGDFELKVIGKDGQARIKDSAGNAFTVDDLVSELKANPKYAGAFDARTGSDAPPGGGGGGTGGGVRTIAANDPVAFGQNLEGIAKGEVTVR